MGRSFAITGADLTAATRRCFWALLAIFAALPSTAADKAVNPEKTTSKWPEQVREITYLSEADNTQQPAMFYAPAGDEPKPLLVALHSWSADYRQTASVPYVNWCVRHGWVFIHPNFRGPNNKPEAMGSELMVKDVLSAVAYAKKTAKIDQSRVYLVGVSGGGYGAMLMAGRSPETWTAVSAWAGISDLKAWYFESVKRKQKYAQDIVRSCGGIPEPGSSAEQECEKRSAITYLARAKGLPLDINAGIHDGHTGSVPISHSLRAFNAVADAKDRITDEDIAFFTDKSEVPPTLKAEAPEDSAYGSRKVLFRRESGKVRLTIFRGTHEIVPDAALEWLSQHRR